MLRPGDGYAKVVERFLRPAASGCSWSTATGGSRGAVSLHDIKHALREPERLTAVVAHDLMVPVRGRVCRDERLHRATEAFAQQRLRAAAGGRRGRASSCGVLAKRDLLAVYAQEVLGRPALLATFVSSDGAASRDYVELPPDFALRRVEVPSAFARAPSPRRACRRPSARASSRSSAVSATAPRSG